MSSFGRQISRRTALLTLAATGLITAAGRQFHLLSADSVDHEECHPSSPTTSNLTAAEEPAPSAPSTPGNSGASLPWSQQGGYINDASCLNRTSIHGIVQVRTEEQIREALAFARAEGKKVSLSGVRHSMGGQAFFTDAVVLDMRAFNAVTVDADAMTMTVQSGATWHDIQNILHPTYAVKAMQSTDIFTVGGSIAVNAHGMDHRAGSVSHTLRSMRLMLPDGTVQRLSPTENVELFQLVVGGYGLFGIVLEATLEITHNAIYATSRRLIDYQDFPALFADELAPNPRLGLMYNHLSTAPQSLLREAILYLYEEQEVSDPAIPPLGEVSATKLRRAVLNLSKQGDLAMRMKWFAEKRIEPLLESCSVTTRNQAMAEGEACLVSRNQPMHDSVAYLRNNLPNETDILHEYFIPRAAFVPFVDGLREIVVAEDVNLLNASVRVVHRTDNLLSYAVQDAFSIVLYINQHSDATGSAKMAQVTSKLIDLTAAVDGRFFLPYQLHYSAEQLAKSYPEIHAFFAAKRIYDPAELLTNTWYEKYRDQLS